MMPMIQRTNPIVHFMIKQGVSDEQHASDRLSFQKVFNKSLLLLVPMSVAAMVVGSIDAQGLMGVVTMGGGVALSAWIYSLTSKPADLCAAFILAGLLGAVVGGVIVLLPDRVSGAICVGWGRGISTVFALLALHKAGVICVGEGYGFWWHGVLAGVSVYGIAHALMLVLGFPVPTLTQIGAAGVGAMAVASILSALSLEVTIRHLRTEASGRFSATWEWSAASAIVLTVLWMFVVGVDVLADGIHRCVQQRVTRH
jgi:hypothetical protein